MKNRPFENRVVIIGSNHHNTLSAIRAFGKKGCRILLIIHGLSPEDKKIPLLCSRYLEKENVIKVGNDPTELLSVLSRSGDLAEKKEILFPTSDYAEMVIDENYELLSERYLLPGFADMPGEVCQMMDKWNQYLLSQRLGIPMAQTYLINTFDATIPQDLMFPCIIKPRISALGSKNDIVVCQNRSEAISATSVFQKNGYKDALVQVFLEKEFEAVSFGLSLWSERQKTNIGGIALKIRERVESATSYAVFASDGHSSVDESYDKFMEAISDANKKIPLSKEQYELLISTNQKLLRWMAAERYSGMYDIEYLVCGNSVYLNEINFRHSGNGYSMIDDEFNAPFVWAKGMLGLLEEIPEDTVKIGTFFMAELSDKTYVKRKKVSLWEWLRDVRRADAFAVYDRQDLKATCSYYFSSLKNIITRIK